MAYLVFFLHIEKVFILTNQPTFNLVCLYKVYHVKLVAFYYHQLQGYVLYQLKQQNECLILIIQYKKHIISEDYKLLSVIILLNTELIDITASQKSKYMIKYCYYNSNGI